MKKSIIKNQIDMTGTTVYIKDGDWTSVPFKACVSHLWRKKSTAFEPDYEALGKSLIEYYLYIGPYDHDITMLSDDAIFMLGDTAYELRYADAVKFNGETIYFTGILKKIKGNEFNEN